MMNFDFGSMFNGMFKPVPRGNAKLAMNGKIAIRTSTGYKTFDVKTKKLVNCDNFAFDMDNMFWVVPTFKVEVGDIILVNNKPRAVLEVNDNSIKTFSYDDSTIVETVPEAHVFMGKTYCYGKIFSPFSNMGGNMSGMMKMMMMSQMFGGSTNAAGSNNMMSMMMMSQMFGGDGLGFNFGDMFEGAFDFGDTEVTIEKEEKGDVS